MSATSIAFVQIFLRQDLSKGIGNGIIIRGIFPMFLSGSCRFSLVFKLLFILFFNFSLVSENSVKYKPAASTILLPFSS